MENEEKFSVDTENLKEETKDTVNQVKESIKNVNFKNDAEETKGFLKEMLSNPFEAVRKIACEEENVLNKVVMIMLVFIAASFAYALISVIKYGKYSGVLDNILSLVAGVLDPVFFVLAPSIMILLLNKNNKLDNDELKNYRAKAEYYVRQHQDNMVIAKLRTNKPLTVQDISVLENILWNELGTKEEYEEEYGSKPLGEFIREIVGLDMNAAKEAFSEFLNETSMDSRQIYFVNQIVEYIVHNGIMKDLSVLQEPPFTDKGSVVEVFTDLNLWMGIRKVIEQINTNAAA